MKFLALFALATAVSAVPTLDILCKACPKDWDPVTVYKTEYKTEYKTVPSYVTKTEYKTETKYETKTVTVTKDKDCSGWKGY